MSRVFWRIATDTPDYEAHDLTGRGAEATGGRWNEKGVPAVYASATRALACLETIVHLNAGGLPFNRYLVAVTVPDAIWAGASREPVERPVVGWDAEPAGRVSIAFRHRLAACGTIGPARRALGDCPGRVERAAQSSEC